MRVSRAVEMWQSAESARSPWVHHEPVVAGGQGWVGAAGVIGGHEQGLAQRRVTGLGGRPVMSADAG